MDLFQYLKDYQAWVCVPCGFAINPDHYESYLRSRHLAHLELGSREKVKLIVLKLLQKPLLNPKNTHIPVPTPGSLTIPFLSIYNNGLACLQCSYVAQAEGTMRAHCQATHVLGKRKRGGNHKAYAAAPPRWKKVVCQRLFVHGHGGSYFAVVSPA